MVREIDLRQHGVALVDDDLYAELAPYRWYYADKRGVFRVQKRPPPHRTIYLHRVITGAPDGYFVEHIDGDKRNNQRANLRLVTRAQSIRARHADPPISRTGYRGVSGCADGRYEAHIRYERRKVIIGRYPTAIAASFAYDAVARRIDPRIPLNHPGAADHDAERETTQWELAVAVEAVGGKHGSLVLAFDEPPHRLKVRRLELPNFTRIGSHLRVLRSHDGQRVLQVVPDPVAGTLARLSAATPSR